MAMVFISFLTFSYVFQNHFQLTYSQHGQDVLSNNSQYSHRNDVSNALLEQFKEIVFDHSLSGDSSNISAPIIVGVVTPNGTQVSGYGNVSNINPSTVDGNTVFDIASISKTFVAIILADMVNQGMVKLDDPVEKYLPADRVIVPSFNGHKITLEDLATHTSGMPDFPIGCQKP